MRKWSRTLRNLGLLLVCFLLLAFGVRSARRAMQPAPDDLAPLMLTMEPRDFTLTISAQGELQAAQSSSIAVPPVPVQRLRIASVVANGRYVNKGDVLVEFDPTDLELQKRDHQASQQMAEQKINKGELASGTEKTDINKDRKLAELDLRKVSEFMPQDELIFTQRQIIEGQLDKGYAEKKIVYADARLTLKGKVYTLDEAILQLERKQADAMLGRVDKALTSLTLIAPASGIVVYPANSGGWNSANVMPGKVVWIGMTLFNLVNPEKMEAKVSVLEKDAGELKTDQPVTLTLDPFPGREFNGKVKTVDKVARPIDRGSPVKYFETTITLERTDTELMKPGVKLVAAIRASELKSVFVVPRSAVTQKDDAHRVFVQTAPGHYESRNVKLGQGDLAQVVVNEGLQRGQVIALNPPDLKRESKTSDNRSQTTDRK
ncbi:MAG: HlyD family efflux transporter periplasmic adaptor subunit [Acidobacteria bacterium]|nr:HlyD family efflux transporter periplasmic adaptor subunit [Acidobacteriota bacterium]